MIHLTVLMALLAVTHIFCLAVMTERKYSLKKTLTVYTVFGVVFVGLAVGTVALFGDRTAQAGIAAFSSSVFVAFFVFILTSADPFWKKLVSQLRQPVLYLFQHLGLFVRRIVLRIV